MDPTALTGLASFFKDFGPWTFSAFLLWLYIQERGRSTKFEEDRFQGAKDQAVLATRLVDAVNALKDADNVPRRSA